MHNTHLLLYPRSSYELLNVIPLYFILYMKKKKHTNQKSHTKYQLKSQISLFNLTYIPEHHKILWCFSYNIVRKKEFQSWLSICLSVCEQRYTCGSVLFTIHVQTILSALAPSHICCLFPPPIMSVLTCCLCSVLVYNLRSTQQWFHDCISNFTCGKILPNLFNLSSIFSSIIPACLFTKTNWGTERCIQKIQALVYKLKDMNYWQVFFTLMYEEETKM